MRALTIVFCLAVALSTASDVVRADTVGDGLGLGAEDAVKQSSDMLLAGKPSAAVDLLEALADRGQSHPDLSFNRGLAYLKRAQSSAPESGDWGQAAAGFAETLERRPDDAVARRALEDAQLSAAKARHDKDSTTTHPLGLTERALLFLSPLVLFFVAALGSFAMTLALLLFRRKSSTGPTWVWTALGVGALFLSTSVGLAFARSYLFADSRAAVVIVRDAQVLDESGRRQVGVPSLPEAMLVYIDKPEHGLAALVGFHQTAYIRMNQLRVVSPPGK